MFFILNSSKPEEGVLAFSTAFNIAASVLLIFALVPTFLDAKKYKKTFGIEEKFLKFFFFGATAMWLNGIVFIIKSIIHTEGVAAYLMFGGFIVSNTVSMFVNFYSWQTKRKNMSEAAKLGLTEQVYWETVVQPTLNVGESPSEEE